MIRSYLTVGLLCLINLLNYMDRFTVAGVLNEIQKYFGMTDATAGLLQTVFICSYMVFAPIFGFIGDRYSRKIVIIGGVIFWSTVTLLSSFVQEHHTLMFFVFRGLVGIGEASYSTVAPTIIADLFFGKQRSTMIAFFYFAIPVGSGLGYIVGSQMATAFGSWHWALRLTPFLGFISAALYCFMPEPKRGGCECLDPPTPDNQSAINAPTPERIVEPEGWRANIQSVQNDISYLLKVPTYVFTSLGFTCVCFSIGALSWWAPKFMALANIEITFDRVSFIFGVIACLGGIFGVLIGSVLSQTLRPTHPKIDPLICGIGVLGSIPFLVTSLITARSSPTVAWICIFIAITLLSTNWSVIADILLYVIVPTKRSSAAAFQILVSHLLGDAASPFIVGLISSTISSGSDDADSTFHSLSYALFSTPIVLVLGALFFVYSSRFVLKDEHNCKNLISGSDASIAASSSPTVQVTSENTTLMSSASNANLVQRC